MTKLVKPLPKKFRRPNDKIFDNKFNRGEIEYQPFEKSVEIDKRYINDIMINHYDSYDYYRMSKLNEEINRIYVDTKWDEAYKNKRIPKFELSEIFEYIRSKITDTTYSEIEIFIEIADCLAVKYNTLYEMVPNLYKKKLLEELNENFDIVEKIKKYRLF